MLSYDNKRNSVSSNHNFDLQTSHKTIKNFIGTYEQNPQLIKRRNL